MFIALYRWRIKPGAEAQFQAAWSAVTLYYRDNFGSCGSRLHRGSDGIFYAYAVWPSDKERQRAFEVEVDVLLPHRKAMEEAIEERLDEVLLEPIADHLI